MEIHNLLAGYIKVNILNRNFVVQLPYKTLKVKSIKDIDENGNMLAICTMDNGCDYIRYIDLSEVLKHLGVDRIAFNSVLVVA